MVFLRNAKRTLLKVYNQQLRAYYNAFYFPETYGVYTYKQADDPARVVYLAACKRLNIVPDKSFLKGLGTGAINVSHQGLGPKDTKAMSLSLVVRLHYIIPCLALIIGLTSFASI